MKTMLISLALICSTWCSAPANDDLRLIARKIDWMSFQQQMRYNRAIREYQEDMFYQQQEMRRQAHRERMRRNIEELEEYSDD